MSIPRRIGAISPRQFLGLERKRLFSGLATDEFGSKARDRDRSLTTEGLEGSPIDDLFAFFFLELDPKPQHLTAIGIADSANRVGVGQLTHVLRIFECFGDPFLEVVVHSAYPTV